MNPIVLKKDHPDMPDHYGMTIQFLVGGEDKIEVVSHKIIGGNGFPVLEILDKDNLWRQIPLSSIKQTKFDHRFTRTVEIRSQLENEKGESK